MSRAVVCDSCGSICQGNQYFSLDGWWGKGQYYPGNRREAASWDLIVRQDLEGLSADLCPGCLSNCVGLNELNPVKTRQALMKELQDKHPQMPVLTLLRKTVGMSAISITCDICQTDCMTQHLRIKAGWLTPSGEELSAELCEPCINSALIGAVRFQAQLPKQPTSQFSTG